MDTPMMHMQCVREDEHDVHVARSPFGMIAWTGTQPNHTPVDVPSEYENYIKHGN